MGRNVKMYVFLAMAVALAAGCSSNSVAVKTTSKPDWVDKGSGAFGGDRGKVFYGVASASNINNPSLLRSAADNRARNEVAKVFQVYTASLMKDYQASVSAGQAGVTSEEGLTEQAVKTFTSMTLSGVEIVDHWENPAKGEMFALARLDLNAFKDSLDRTKELSAKAKEHIRQNADRLHGELEKMEGGAKGKGE